MIAFLQVMDTIIVIFSLSSGGYDDTYLALL